MHALKGTFKGHILRVLRVSRHPSHDFQKNLMTHRGKLTNCSNIDNLDAKTPFFCLRTVINGLEFNDNSYFGPAKG